MIITKEQFDEFVESAENHNILWTDTLALIGVTVGDVPDVDVIEAQAAEIARLREAAAEERARIVTWLRNGNAWLNGGECCGFKDSDGVCLAPACEWGEQLALLHKVADAIEAQEVQS